ncbi:hypothetical protein [Clostridium saccharobutylicum]|uniref:Uncharacterized protein n=1 Tax=Clostridium saccharobutylicum TaxID=169679 RepID=A0A1S8NHE7_CLOSA|nr:hypothetical protein [Clostridium saccharobutylicum]OOM15850.1 hypothetical protein CLOSAC_01210 [Clostridium saccharobutylicum]
MLDIITLIGIIIGIILIIYSSKKQNRVLRNIGIFIILICLIYVVPSFLKGFAQGFVEGASSVEFH